MDSINKEQLWKTVLGELEVIISRASFTTWFKDTNLATIKKNKAVINVPNGFTQEWLKNKYNKLIVNALQNNCPRINQIDYFINTPRVDNKSIIEKINKPKKYSTDSKIKYSTDINSRYTFDSFIIGSNNELAHAACTAILKKPGKNYNPVFIYGGVGLGKTHLLQAVGNQLLNAHPNWKICYIPAEKFTNEFIDAVKHGNTKEFKNRYRDVDSFIVDDIQFIAGKERTQEEFFHTFNTLYGANKQIILSSDRPPKAIPTIEERLRSRFEGGMIADIGLPDIETRLAILKVKSEFRGFDLPNTIIEYLAQNIQTNIRELEGGLNKILAYAELKKQIPSFAQTKKLLQNTILTPKNKITNVKQILKTVAEFYDVSIKDLVERSRRRKIVKPRQIAMYLMREELHSSYPSIGEEFDKRDHTTVIHAYEKVTREISENESLKQEMHLITQRLYTE